jgi:hypothetical protein
VRAVARIKLDRLREPLRDIEDLLADLQAAIEDGDLDAAREALDAYVSGDDEK